MVKFCESCGNLYGHKVVDKDHIAEKGPIVYHCDLCGHEAPIKEQCLVVNELNHNAHDYQLNFNMVHDCTYPRTLKMTCPNEKCESKHEGFAPEIIIFQYNPEVLNVGYMCKTCYCHWKN